MLNKIYFIVSLIILPVFASAQLTGTRSLLDSVLGIVSVLIPIAFALAILFFFWGIAKYILSSGTAKEDSKSIMLWGVIAIFVMTSIWGLVRFIDTTFGLDPNTSAPKIPTIKPV